MDIPMYDLTELAVPNNRGVSHAMAVSAHPDGAQVAGFVTLPPGTNGPNALDSAIAWYGQGDWTTLTVDEGSGVISAQALGLNSMLPPTVVGWASKPNSAPFPTYWIDGDTFATSLDTAIGQFRAVNNQNFMAGWKLVGSVHHAVVYTPEHVFVDLGPHEEQWVHEAIAINDNGLVAGWTTFSDGLRKACIWDLGANYQNLYNAPVYAPLDPPTGIQIRSQANDINSDGQIVMQVEAGVISGYETNKYGYRTYPDPGYPGNPNRYDWEYYLPLIPSGINDSGFIVGNAAIVPNSQDLLQRHAFVCVAGPNAVGADLNTRLIGGQGWQLLQAIRIDGIGQIVGLGRNPDGNLRAYLLTPVA